MDLRDLRDLREIIFMSMKICVKNIAKKNISGYTFQIEELDLLRIAFKQRSGESFTCNLKNNSRRSEIS